jgi:glutamyl-tRNA synthetase
LVRALQERSQTLRELTEKARFWLAADEAIVLPPHDDKNVKKWLDAAGLAALEAALGRLDAIEPFETAAIHAALTELADAGYEGKLGRVAQPLRLAITGSTASPPIDETLALVGRPAVRARIARALEHYRAA